MATAVMSPLGPVPMKADEENEELYPMVAFPVAVDQLAEKKTDKESVDDAGSVPDLTEDALDMTEEAAALPLSFTGLDNLGNTCYLSSALQMLASLDHFVPSLEASPLPEPEQHADENDTSTKEELRKAFLDLVQSLRQGGGRSVSPSVFKRTMDTRSSLFVGYRQQDSHEFLLTLLDLLDEDYQVKEEEEMETDCAEEISEGDVKQTDDDAMEQVEETPAVDECLPTPPESPLRRLRSFSQLGIEDISYLLHGTKKARETCATPAEAMKEPQCKLVGGRAVMPGTAVALHSSSAGQGMSSSAVAKLQQNCETHDTESERMEQEESDPSPVEDYFATNVRSRLTCDSCKYSRSHVEKYLHLSLDIGTESGSVEDGVRKFFASESRQIKCEKCFCETATQTMEIVRLPRALLFHFKRFIVDVSPDYTRVSYRKNQSPVDFNETLSLDDMGVLNEFLAADVEIPTRLEHRSPVQVEDDEMDTDENEQSYHLRSIVNHIGSSASCGHYTADGNRLYPSTGDREWTRFNDSRVTKVSDQQAMGEAARRTAYMVVYELE